MTFVGKKKKDTFRDILQMDNTNSGVDGTTRVVKDGEGTSSALQISNDKILCKPSSENSTTTFQCQTASGSALLAVDTTNSTVKAGTSQVHVNTHYQTFSSEQLSAVANTWYPLSHISSLLSSTSDNLGTGTNPATTFTATFRACHFYWYIHDNITIDTVRVFLMGDDSASTDTLSFNLSSYFIDTAGAGAGDLSSGTIHANSSGKTIDNADLDQHNLSLVGGNENCDAGRIILALVRGGSTINNDISCQISIKYHIR